jgi:hypothetical protein
MRLFCSSATRSRREAGHKMTTGLHFVQGVPDFDVTVRAIGLAHDRSRPHPCGPVSLSATQFFSRFSH